MRQELALPRTQLSLEPVPTVRSVPRSPARVSSPGAFQQAPSSSSSSSRSSSSNSSSSSSTSRRRLLPPHWATRADSNAMGQRPQARVDLAVSAAPEAGARGVRGPPFDVEAARAETVFLRARSAGADEQQLTELAIAAAEARLQTAPRLPGQVLGSAPPRRAAPGPHHARGAAVAVREASRPFENSFDTVVPGLCAGNVVEMAQRQQHEMARQRARPAQHRSLRARPAQTQTSIGFGGVSLAHTLSSSPAFAAIQSVRPHVAAPHPL